MRNQLVLVAVLALLLAAPTALALDGMAHVEIVGDQHVVTVTGCIFIEDPAEIAGIVIECQVIGGCESAFFAPETPMPIELVVLPEECSGYQATITVTPPHPEAATMYTPYWVDQEGTLTPTTHYCDSDLRTFALAMTEQTPLTRGLFVFAGFEGADMVYQLEPCQEDCWLFAPRPKTIAEIEALSGLPFAELSGLAVDLYGDRSYCRMPGGPIYDLTRIELAPGGSCGPVPVSETTWDGLKAMYR